MRFRVCEENLDAEALLPPSAPDGSGIGVNYIDAYARSLDAELPDGRKLTVRRKGLKLTLTIGESSGEAIVDRLADGPDPRRMLRSALERAASRAGAKFLVEDGTVYLEVPAS